MRRVWILLAIAVLAYCAALLTIIDFERGRDDAAARVEHTNTVIRDTQQILLSAVDMETGKRGFAITHNAAFLQPYSKAEPQIQQLLVELEQLVADNPAQVKRVDELEHSVERLKTALQAPGVTETNLLQAKSTMDGIRQQIEQINKVESELLADRRAKLDEAKRMTIAGFIGFSIVGLAVLIWAGLSSIGKEELERIVRERTNELRVANEEANAARAAAELALEAKSRFLSTVSHEVRTPMAGIIGLAEVMSYEDLGEENNRTMSAILEASKRLLRMLNNVLDASRLESNKVVLEKRKFPLRAVLGDVRQLASPEADKKNVTFLGSVTQAVPEYVCGDELRVRQVLMNLVHNAVKFTQQGTITINADLIAEDGPSKTIRFDVIDTGIGLTDEQLSRLFLPFGQATSSTSRVSGGSGLGLSIAKELVALMGGQIGVTSNIGKGSTFWFELTFSEDECEA